MQIYSNERPHPFPRGRGGVKPAFNQPALYLNGFAQLSLFIFIESLILENTFWPVRIFTRKISLQQRVHLKIYRALFGDT